MIQIATTTRPKLSPLEHAEYLSEKLDGELIIKPGQFHFSIGSAGERYKQFPELLEMILQKSAD